jgi:DNA-binding CsgD family transcriptional regulator
MWVNGNALLARKMAVTRRFGSEAWNRIFSDVASRFACFRDPLTAASRVPLGPFLAFHDDMLRRLFDDNVTRYVELGEQSALWAFQEGPYQALIANRDIAQFVEAVPSLWRAYFPETTSRCEAKLVDGDVEYEVFDLPDWHPYFEYLIAGYHKAALNLMYINPVGALRVHGGSRRGYKYVFRAGATDDWTEGSSARRLAREARAALSSRELDVLRLITNGKTNKEIAAILAISARTVQTHTRHIYDKIGVWNRASAATWLAEQHGARPNGDSHVRTPLY